MYLIQQWLGRLLMPMVVALLASGAGFVAGYLQGDLKCKAGVAVATTKAEAQATKTAVKTMARATATGGAREADRAAIDHVFTTLAQEAAHETEPDPAVSCVLPADRLRIWAAANAGAADTGAPAAELDGPAPAAATTGIGPAGGPGSQPSRGGPGLPPAGQPDVQVAGIFAGAP